MARNGQTQRVASSAVAQHTAWIGSSGMINPGWGCSGTLILVVCAGWLNDSFRFHMDNITYCVLCAMLSLFWFLLPTLVGPTIFCSWLWLHYVIKINIWPYICIYYIIISIWNGQQIPAAGQDTSAWTWSGLSSRLSWRTLQSGEMGSRYAWNQPIDLHVQRSSYTDPFFGFRIWLEKKH